MKKFLTQTFPALVFLLGLASAASAAESSKIYLELSLGGSEIGGDVETAGLEGTIECLGFEHELFSADGEHTIQHGTVKFIKRLNKATPKILAAYNAKQTGSALFKFYGRNDEGSTVEIFQVELHNARVRSTRLWRARESGSETAPEPVEEIQLAYDEIVYQSEDDGSGASLIPGSGGGR